MPSLCNQPKDTPQSDRGVTATKDVVESNSDMAAPNTIRKSDRDVAAIDDVAKAFILANRLGNADMLKSLCISSAKHLRK